MVSVPLENTEKLVWTVMVSIENVKFKVLVDTGSSGLWVLSSECKNPEFVEKSKYVPKNLPEQNPEMFNLEYINTRVEGVVHSDTVTIGSIRLDNHYFGGATKVESHCRLEGILGLPPTISTVHGPSFINHPDFLREAIEQRKISPKFSINLASPNPRLHLGGIDHRGYTGPIEYHKVVAGGKHWILENCHLTIQQAGHQRTTHTVQLFGRRSLIDTGATAIYGHPEVVKGFYTELGGKSVETTWVFPCHKKPRVTISWGKGKEWEVREFNVGPYYQGLCFGAIQEAWVTDLIIGTIFLQDVYAVFDMEEMKIGFAELKRSAHASHR